MTTSRRPVPFRNRNAGTRVRDGVAAVMLCAGLVLLPFLATVDVGIAVGCRDIGRLACIQLVSRTLILPVMDELGKPPE